MKEKSVLIFGAGQVGRIVARILQTDYNIHIIDASQVALSLVRDPIKKYCISLDTFYNARQTPENAGLLDHKFDLLLNCLPGRYGLRVIQIADELCLPLVDISFMADIVKAKTTCRDDVIRVFDMGIAPGLANMLAIDLLRRGYRWVQILVGGLPLLNTSVWKHKAVFCVEDTLEEYIRPAYYIRDGEHFYIPPLETIRPFGDNYDVFVSDGLRSLMDWDFFQLTEYTIRHRGHLDMMKNLHTLGVLQNTDRDNPFRRELLKDLQILGNEEDFTYLRVSGFDPEGNEKCGYFLQDFYHSEIKTHSMPMCTALPAVFVAKQILSGKVVPTPGQPTVMMPEELVLFDFVKIPEIVDFLGKAGIRVKEFHNGN